MNLLSVKEPTEHRNSACAELTTMAERELAALFSAVTELFGPEQARLAAEDWLHLFEGMNRLPASTREWRRVTIEILALVAKRVKRVHVRSNERPALVGADNRNFPGKRGGKSWQLQQ